MNTNKLQIVKINTDLSQWDKAIVNAENKYFDPVTISFVPDQIVLSDEEATLYKSILECNKAKALTVVSTLIEIFGLDTFEHHYLHLKEEIPDNTMLTREVSVVEEIELKAQHPDLFVTL